MTTNSAPTLAGSFLKLTLLLAVTRSIALGADCGVRRFLADETFRAKPGYHAPEELIALARSHGSAFCPGEY